MTRTSHYAWMALGGLLCLLGVYVVTRARDGNKVMAQSEPPTLVAEKPAPPPAPEMPRMLPPITSEVPPTTPSAALVPVEAVTPTPPMSQPVAGSDSRPIVIPASATIPPPPPADAVPPPPGATLPPIQSEEASVPTPPPSVTPPPVLHAETTPPAEPISRSLPRTAEPNSSSSSASTAPMATEPPLQVGRPRVPEPPLAPSPGPVVQHKVRNSGETFKSLARKMLGSSERWTDIYKLNPNLRPDAPISVGTVVKLPGDACEEEDDEAVRPLPPLRPRTLPKPRALLPLTGTYPIALDDQKMITLPRKILDQLGNCDTVLLSPGSDRCLWLTNQAHLDRLQAKLDKSPARESDVRGFKRLYYAQTVKVPIRDGRLAISEKLAAFAGLGAEVVLVGIDDHFEVWDAARWRDYTQAKKAMTTTED